MYKHVLCVYPYRRELGRSSFYPPLGLEFIAAAIKPYAREIDVIDLRKESGHTTDFLRPETDLVCFSVNWDRDAEFVRQEIRSVPPGIPTILGGRHATEDPELWLRECPNVDVVVRGDGEDAVSEFCQGKPLGRIAGISYRKDGGLAHTPFRKAVALRDDLYPDRRLRRYTYTAANSGIAIDSVAASRGCPYNCTFCSFSRNPWGEKRAWAARSPESVARELSEIKAQIVGFTDDNFAFDLERVGQLCDIIKARGIRKKYIVNARIEIARRPDILRKMEQAGFAALLLGIESANDKTLRSMRKGFDTAKIREYFQVLSKTSMWLHGYFIIGSIGESEEEILKIGPFARELGLDSLGLSMLRSSPYSGLDELVASCAGYHVAPNGKIFSEHISLERLAQLRRRITHQFYTPGRVFRIFRKGCRNGLLRFLPTLLPRIPVICWDAARHSWRRRAKRRTRHQAVTAGRLASGA